MKLDAATLRAEAETLARILRDQPLAATAAEATHVGSAGRRRAGTGEHFWQYRRYAQEDAAERIDWRRSARGNDLYVRETELETARTVLFWCDPHPGFDWGGEGDRETKADAARVLMLATGLLLSRTGERIGVLGSGRAPGFGKRAVDRLAEDLSRPQRTPFPTTPRTPAVMVVASDFYDPIATWKARLAPLAARCPEGVLLSINAPVEREFPFSGRVRFRRPGGELERLFGRAETIAEDYHARFAAQREALKALAGQIGWRLVTHETGTPRREAGAHLRRALETLGART